MVQHISVERKGEEGVDVQDMCGIAARPPVVAVAEPFVPVCADALGLLSDGRGRRIEERIGLGLPLQNLQCKALTCVEGCASSCQYRQRPFGSWYMISYQCGSASTRCLGCLI